MKRYTLDEKSNSFQRPGKFALAPDLLLRSLPAVFEPLDSILSISIKNQIDLLAFQKYACFSFSDMRGSWPCFLQ